MSRMLEEIRQQPVALERTLAGELRRNRLLADLLEQPVALERTLAGELRRVERFKRQVEKRRPRLVVLVARGTSDNAALFGRYLLEITTGIPVSLAAPSIATLY